MEVKFDKEIDSLLRQLAKAERSAFPGSQGSAHLDADEISAFAENALPEKIRGRCIEHLADCGSCRRNLSFLITLNAEDRIQTDGQQQATDAAAAVTPWYQRLFAKSNLAFAMGAIVVAFAGIAFFTIWQSSGGYETARLDSSKTLSEEKPANAPLPAANMTAASNSAPANAEANAAELPARSSAPNITDGGDVPAEPKAQAEAEPFGEPRRDAPSDLKSGSPAPPRTDEIADLTTAKDAGTLGKKENKPEAKIAAAETAPISQPAPEPVEEQPRKREKLKVRSEDEADKDDGAGAARLQSKRQISGKSFTRANGVWYDSAYANQPTTNIRRATPEYRALDQGLRSIAENLGGTVVIVWHQKAYRIQ